MYIKKLSVTLTTAADGSATGYTEVTNGRVLGVIYTPHGTAPFANTLDVTVTAEDSGQPILTKADVSAAFNAYPKVQNHLTGDASAIEGAYDYVPLAGSERIKIALAQGGDTKTGTFTLLVG